jgi:protocatechuate 3,4-dioxygenase beta subunit
MSMTPAQLIAFSEEVFYDNTVGAITPSGMRAMHGEIASGMVPTNEQGVAVTNTTPPGEVSGQIDGSLEVGSTVFDTGTYNTKVWHSGGSPYYPGASGWIGGVPTDQSGVYKVPTVPTGSVATPTATGAMVFNAVDGHLHIFNGTWLTFSAGGGE